MHLTNILFSVLFCSYRVKARKGFNFISTFALRTEDDKSKWVLRGAGLLCSID